MKKIKFIELINNISNIDEYLVIYIPKDSSCELDDDCLLMYYDDKKNKHYTQYKYFCGVNIIISIISNLSQQNNSYTKQDLIKAIKYYYENDAFIDISNSL
jgi:hypothetical protein